MPQIWCNKLRGNKWKYICIYVCLSLPLSLYLSLSPSYTHAFLFLFLFLSLHIYLSHTQLKKRHEDEKTRLEQLYLKEQAGRRDDQVSVMYITVYVNTCVSHVYMYTHIHIYIYIYIYDQVFVVYINVFFMYITVYECV